MVAVVTVEKVGGGVALVTLRKEPVNSMNLDVWQQLQDALDTVEADPEVRLHLSTLRAYPTYSICDHVIEFELS